MIQDMLNDEHVNVSATSGYSKALPQLSPLIY